MCFLEHFGCHGDPRSSINRRHDRLNNVFLTVSAVVSGAQGWNDIKDFDVSPPTVHQMVLTLERNQLMRRVPGAARSLEVLIEPEPLPTLK
jgi:hypothetical protein